MCSKKIIGIIASAATLAAAGAALAGETINYTYDAQGRLIEVAHSGTINNGLVTNYAFDAADSRIAMNTSGSPTPP